MPSLQDQRWDRLESRLDRIEGSLSELREDFAAHKATSTANEKKILYIDKRQTAEIEKVQSGIRRVGWFAASSLVAVIGYLLRELVNGNL